MGGKLSLSSTLTPQQLHSAPVASADELALNEIQGDVLIGLQKMVERFIFFEVVDVAAFKAALRKQIASRITSSSTVYTREFQLRDYKANGGSLPLPMVGLNLGFTNAGIQKLLPGADLGDASFAAGASKQAPSLGDAVDANGNPIHWKPEFLSDNLDGIFLVTGGAELYVDAEVEAILKVLGPAVMVTIDLIGNVRPGLAKNHEHFGWLDGVSQPGINGLTDPFPGQRLLDPGHFVFGYPGQPGALELDWMKNGSFMVFRRLNQMVPEFHNFLLEAAPISSPTMESMDPVLLGARLVGRWQSGAPLALTPSQDNPALGADPQQNDNFDFSDDQGQRRCPFAAHIRKVNPREDFTPVASQAEAVDPHRIIRAGIPFGPEVSESEQAAKATQEERGLMFVCYQTSVSNQFEFVQSSWANNKDFMSPAAAVKLHPAPDNSQVIVGWDPIIGQNKDGQRLRKMDEIVPNYPTGTFRSTLTMTQDFVVPTGGAYFFVPSISALANEFSA